MIGERGMKTRWMNSTILVAVCMSLAGAVVKAGESKQATAKPVSLRVVPSEVMLWGPQASQHFMVIGKYADGLERDVTSSTQFSLSTATKGEIDASGKLYGTRARRRSVNGEGKRSVREGGNPFTRMGHGSAVYICT